MGVPAADRGPCPARDRPGRERVVTAARGRPPGPGTLLGRGEVAALVGVAPMNQESGQWKGHRRTQGGRVRTRRALYMAALNAIVRNPHIKEFHARLKAKGKAGKVALIACASC